MDEVECTFHYHKFGMPVKSLVKMPPSKCWNLSSHLNRQVTDVAHVHNKYLEAFGETGLCSKRLKKDTK